MLTSRSRLTSWTANRKGERRSRSRSCTRSRCSAGDIKLCPLLPTLPDRSEYERLHHGPLCRARACPSARCHVQGVSRRLYSLSDIRYMTLPLPYLTRTLAFEVDDETDEFLAGHSANLYTNPTLPIPPRDPSNPWKPIPPPKATPLAERVWDCRKAHFACAKAVEKYRVVDLKGQVD